MVTLKKKNVIFAISLAISLIFIFSATPFLRRPLLQIIRQPLIVFTWGRREFGALLFYHRNFFQYELYKKEVEALQNKIRLLEEVRLENERLKDMLAFKDASSYRLAAARVIGRSADSWSSTLLIDKGERQGLRKGMAVITAAGFVGRINEVYNGISKVLLISDPDLSISAMDQRSRQEGLVSGTLGNNLIMRYLAPDADIQVGDPVATSGLNPMYPKGLLIGIVVGMNKDLSSVSFHAVIKPAVNLFTLEEVLVVLFQ